MFPQLLHLTSRKFVKFGFSILSLQSDSDQIVAVVLTLSISNIMLFLLIPAISSLPNKNSAPKMLSMPFSFDVTRKFAHTNKLFPSGVLK